MHLFYVFLMFQRRRQEPSQEEIQEVGRSTWTLLHAISKYFPKYPTEREKEAVYSLIDSLSVLYPCRSCSVAFEALSQEKVDASSQKGLSLSLCRFHNFVNRKLEKPEVLCSSLDREPSPMPARMPLFLHGAKETLFGLFRRRV